MKGYDAVVFPQQGEPTPICLEASADDAARTAWTTEVRLFRGYDETDPRPPLARTIDVAREAASGFWRIGLELTLGTQAADRMVGEPTTFTHDYFRLRYGDRGRRSTARARRRNRARGRADALANEIAAAAMEHVRSNLAPG